jgi:RecJ-like exonuclease
LYAIQVHGDERRKCGDCDGEGSLIIHGSLKTCRICGGIGTVPTIDEIRRVMRRFQLPSEFTVCHSRVLLMFRVYDVDIVIHTAQALAVSGIKTRIVFPVF